MAAEFHNPYISQIKKQMETLSPCFCVGPQNGQPLCPCKMRNVIIRNGRYVLPEKDLGPVIEPIQTSTES